MCVCWWRGGSGTPDPEGVPEGVSFLGRGRDRCKHDVV